MCSVKTAAHRTWRCATRAKHPQVAPFIGKLVRLEVSGQGFSIRSATGSEADAFRQSHAAERSALRRRGSICRCAVRSTSRARGSSICRCIGAKAAQLAELGRISRDRPELRRPDPDSRATPFAMPLVHYVEHFERSGAKAQLEAAQQTVEFRGDPARRAEVLAQIRDSDSTAPTSIPTLLAQLRERTIDARFGHDRVRFRSSSNTEDLPGFNGAGLYESWSAAIDDPERPIADALRSVWASLWLPRAYDEREFGNIDQSGVAMGVLVHPAFLSERANVIVDLARRARPDALGYLLHERASRRSQRGESRARRCAPSS